MTQSIFDRSNRLDFHSPLERDESVRFLGRGLSRPPPAFTRRELRSLLRFVQASQVIPEGPGGNAFNIASRPYLRALYLEQRRNPWMRLVIMKAAQTGLTIKLLYRAAWWCADARAQVNTALMFPTLDAVLELHKSRFRPMMRSSPGMMSLIQDVDSVGLVRVGVSNMRFRGMNSGVGLDSFPADVMMFDEMRLMSLATIERALVRLSKSKLEGVDLIGESVRGVVELNSTAGFPDLDIDWWFSQSDMNYWATPCANPGCKHHHDQKDWLILPLLWPSCVGFDGARPFYQCPHCQTEIPDSVLLKHGAYHTMNPNPKGGYKGFQFSQIVNGNKELPELWRAFNRGHNLAEFYNSRLGLPWRDPNAVPATRDVVLQCKDDSLRWPGLSDTNGVERDARALERELKGAYIAVGIDQRAPEKHVVIYRLGTDGRFELVHLEVVEASAHDAALKLAAICEKFHYDIVVVDGKPSYDLAVDLARLLRKGTVWLGHELDDQEQAVQFKDRSQSETIRKVSGELKYELIVVADAYKAMDWHLSRFTLRQAKLPVNFEALIQPRTFGGVTEPLVVGQEFLTHLENIARGAIPKHVKMPDGSQANRGQIRMIYRYLKMDPHFAHASMFAMIGISRRTGIDTIYVPPATDNQTVDSSEDTQLELALPEGFRPSDARAARAAATQRICGTCRFWTRFVEGQPQGRCGHPVNLAHTLLTDYFERECEYFETSPIEK